jgi:6-phosphogluconolactonase (cycloisomerase 2 family)
MLQYIRPSAWGVVLLALFPVGLAAQNFVYTNNDLATANSISAFSVDTNGTLSEIGDSPVETGGAGNGTSTSLYSPNRIVVFNNFLFTSNAASNDVSAFTVDAGTGVLSAVNGSPFPTDAFDDSNQSGISLAVTPDGRFLYAGSTGSGGQITIFSINSSGALMKVVPPAGSSNPVAAGGPVYGMKVSGDGKFLAVALYQTSQIAVFAIQSDGTLQAVTNSPFTLAFGAATSVDINCDGNLLFAGGNSGNIYAFNIASDGQLALVTDPPLATGLSSNQVVALSTDDSTLFSSNQGGNTVAAFAVGSDGSLTVLGTPAGAGTGAFYPGGLSVSQDRGFLYAADTAVTGGFGGISTFTLGGALPISFASLTSTAIASQLHSVAAYPAKACANPPPSAGLTADLQVATNRPPRFDLKATLSLDSSLVADPLTQPVTIQIGDFSFTLPAGSFKIFQHGVNMDTYLFQGVVGSSKLKVQIASQAQNEFQISVYGKQVDLSGLESPVTVAVEIGDNSASASVTPVVGELRGNWRDF